MHNTAIGYLASGLCVLPAMRTGSEKRVALASWKDYQSRLPEREELDWWFGGSAPRGNALCIVCGRVSGNLEMIDFDLQGEAFSAWCDAVAQTPGGADLLARLVIETSPSGGMHAIYRCEREVAGNLKIAQRRIACESEEPIVVGDKEFVPRRDAQGLGVVLTLIETRGEGGLFLCAPSEGYGLTQGDFANVPTITAEQRDTLLSCAWALNEVHTAPIADAPRSAQTHANPPAAPRTVQGLTPGSDYNIRGDVRDVLLRAGWRSTGKANTGGEHFTRPGKTAGTSATLRVMEGVPVFYVFSSNAPPFNPGQGYAPFAVYALLEHAGDYSAAASALRKAGFGEPSGSQGLTGSPMPSAGSVAVNLSHLMSSLGVASPGVHSPPTTDAASVPSPGPSQAPAANVSALDLLPRPVYVGDLVDSHPRLRPPVIHGLLREGETMNVIAAPKTGKSWLTLDLAIAVATGSPWLDRYATAPQGADVLIIDNELHPETSASRIPKVAKARNVGMHEIARRIAIDNLRGRLRSIFDLAPYFAAIEPGQFKVIVLDAFYRFMPIGGDENDNGTMSSIYNYIDAFADRLGCCFVLIHHSTKGSQSAKSVTDVGAGAGAQSRAADTHLVLRPHEEEGVIVLDAAVRSWRPIDPACLRWSFPVWNYDPGLDPTQLKGEGRSKRARGADSSASNAAADPRMSSDWTTERFVREFFVRPMTMDDVRAATADESTLSWRKVNALVKRAEIEGLLTRTTSGQGSRATFHPTKPTGHKP